MVVGLARSGVAAAEFLARRGAAVVAADRKAEGELAAEALAPARAGRPARAGAHRRETFTGAAMVVVSPGVPWDLPELAAARAAGRAGDRRDRAGLPPPARAASPRSPAPRASPRPPRPSARCCARRGGDVRVGGNIGTPLVGLVEGSTGADRLRGRGVELPARGHRALPPARGGLAEPLARPPRPPPVARGLRRGEGAHLREPDGRRTGRS